MTSPEEIERVGLHDCATIGCETPCGGGAQEYHDWLLLKEKFGEFIDKATKVAQEAKGISRP